MIPLLMRRRVVRVVMEITVNRPMVLLGNVVLAACVVLLMVKILVFDDDAD